MTAPRGATDFTPVCTTEFLEFARNHDRFVAKNTEVVGLSVDAIYAHLGWVKAIEDRWKVKIPFRVIADRNMKIATLWGMIQPNEAARGEYVDWWFSKKPLAQEAGKAR